MKTLVIHPQDVTTDFLKLIYCDRQWTIINTEVRYEAFKLLLCLEPKVNIGAIVKDN